MQNLIEKIIDFSQKKKCFSGLEGQEFAAKEFSAFVKIFYSENQNHDFLNYSVEELCNAARLSFDFFVSKKSDESKIRICNPTIEKNGFESPYSLLDIVNQDMPFLVDSTVAYLDKCGIRVRNIIHPIYSVNRSQDGKLEKISAAESSKQESVIQLHLDKITSESDIAILQENIGKILKNIALVVSDWKSMLELIQKASDQTNNAKKISEETNEIKEFLSWLEDGNFILLGAVEFDIREVKKGEYSLVEVKDSGLGIFRSEHEEFRPEVMNLSFEEVGDSVANPYVIEVLKSRYRSRIHRIANAERIRVQKISATGEVIGEFRFIGLFTSSTYYKSTNSIPLIRGKIARVIADSGYIKGGHNYKDLISTLESYPRDELFQISAEDLLKNATGIVAICGRSQVRFFARKDKFNRFVSCLIFTPRDHSNSELRDKIKNYLAEVYHGEIADSFAQITDSNLARLHVIIRTNKGIPQVDELTVERRITKMTKVWSDDLLEAIRASFGDKKQVSLFAKYKNGFSVSYINRFDPKRAAIDISRIEECLEKNRVLFNLYKSSEGITELKIFSPEKELILSAIMPILESFGFNVIQEHTYTVNAEEDEKIRSRKKVWIHYFHLNLSKSGHKFSEKIRLNFEKTISLIWQEVAQVGFLNRLIIAADMHWKQVHTLRAYSKYLYQTGFRYSEPHIADILVRYCDLSKLLVELFEAKFDPFLKITSTERQERIEQIAAQIDSSLNQVQDITDDTLIRRFFAVIKATLRTNYYQSAKDGSGFKGYLSFKFDCKKVPSLPLPVPHAEIFVYSSRVEAIHLRGGKVARGGLRWSDRGEDFRTEILGLMKAQTTKNAVIVPVGSKGGFVLKHDLTGLGRDEIQKEGIECYKTFLRGLLDITDNVVNGVIEHPRDLVLHDAPDPYLVVAADKGTATFSDIANAISAEYNFWLGDAFASGGSVGYDHKKMGITAKGAWISVMRHFREMGIDTQSQDFTCIGIGDLAGDVFGNGMLLSPHIKLVAAFNHLHIFLDPSPDAARSFVERERIFNLPRSSWLDYDQSLISKGGGVFERGAKSIKISPEIKAVLAIAEDELAPSDLIRAILKAPLDLLWNGGIGTYVKSVDESNQEVSDRANDVLRINGNELRCRVVGEGGNLGFTQKGRIEYALSGGRINSDAMDNSAGVDCSDHEVNIKIALTSALRSKKITLEERNKILEAMTDEVSHLVLRDNHLQTQAISIAFAQGVAAITDQSQFLDRLEKSGLLNRKIEFLPSKKEIDKRQNDKIGLTRPELCVMLAYSKMDIYNQILNSDLVKDGYFEQELFAYFPKIMREKFSGEIKSHQLRNEIIATQITNFVVNRIGITFISQISQDSGFAVSEVVKNFIIACDSFRLREVWEEIENLDGNLDANTQMQMFLAPSKLLERSVMWLLRNRVKGDVAAVIARFQKIADELSDVLSQVLAQASQESYKRKIEKYHPHKVSRKLAGKIAAMDPVASAFDIAEISAASSFDLKTIAKIYFAVGNRFSLKWLRSRLNNMSLEGHWQKLSSKTILEDFYSYQMRIAKEIVDFSCDDQNLCEINSLDNWIKKSDFLVERFDNFIADFKAQPNVDLAMFVVALNRLKPLVG
jgi:glutamate dehydrogenase